MRDEAELLDGFTSFSLSLDADEPLDPEDRHDQWLMVSISVRAGSRVWSDADTCLTVAEVRRLAEWMDSIATGSDPAGGCNFREANLGFAARTASGETRLVVACALEFAPPEWTNQDPYELTFPYDRDQARAFAGALRAQLASLGDPDPPSPDPLRMLPRRRP